MFFLLLYELVVADDLSPASLLQLQAERQLRLSARQDREDGNSEVDDPLRQSAELLEDILVEDMVEERVGHGVPLAKRMTERRHDISGAGMRHGHLAETIDQPSQGEGAATPRVLVVGTHHKTGTFLVENLLQEMQKSILDAGHHANISNYYNTERYKWRLLEDEHGWSSEILLIHLRNTVAADFKKLEDRFGVGAFRYLQIARDPVSLVISAYLYHMHSDDCANACPDDLQQMRNARVTQGLRMQSGRALVTTLKEQREVAELICTKNPAQYRAMLLNEFSDNYDDAVAELYNFLAGGLVTDEVIAAAKLRAGEHDVKRWSEDRKNKNEHVHVGVQKEEVIALWTSQNTELEPELSLVNKERVAFSSIIKSCQGTGE